MSRRLLRDLGTWRFWARFGLRVFAVVGVEAMLLGLFDVIKPDAISKLSFPVILAVVLIALIIGAVRSWPRPVEEKYSAPKTEIRLIPGNLFDCPDNLVIGMSNTFDTAVPHIIQRGSVQGQFLEKVYKQDQDTLDQDLTKALIRIQSCDTIDKEGKETVYPVGTIAVLRQHRTHYFCVAYSAMDKNNNAQADIDGLWRSLMNLWEAVRQNTNGEAVAIPIIGGGQSRLSQVLPAQDSIRFIALSFMFASRQKRVCERLDIFVRPEDLNRIDMLEFQDFLTSLKPS